MNLNQFKVMLTAACFLVLPLVAHAANKAPAKVVGATSIQKLVSDFSAEWNKHDAKAMANKWIADGDLITAAGHNVKGTKELEAYFTKEHRGLFADFKSSVKILKIRMLDANTAFVDAECSMTKVGHGDVKSHPAMKQRVVFVAKKSGSVWNFVSARAYVFLAEPSKVGTHICPKDGHCAKCDKNKKMETCKKPVTNKKNGE